MVGLGLSWGLLWVPLGLWLGWRYGFSGRSQATWALFILLFGVAGFLAFVAVQEWPARKRCPGCGRLRVVTNQLCEHCGQPFPPPPKTGAEIFEVAVPQG